MSYHTLPCGRTIPNEGLKAWVRFRDCKWIEKTIIACVNSKAVGTGDGLVIGVAYDEYALVPPGPMKQPIESIKLAGKWLRYGREATLIVAVHPDYICTVHEQLYMTDLVEDMECQGWSDTADGEIKSFWITGVTNSCNT
jgi:hypothetical protein